MIDTQARSGTTRSKTSRTCESIIEVLKENNGVLDDPRGGLISTKLVPLLRLKGIISSYATICVAVRALEVRDVVQTVKNPRRMFSMRLIDSSTMKVDSPPEVATAACDAESIYTSSPFASLVRQLVQSFQELERQEAEHTAHLERVTTQKAQILSDLADMVRRLNA